MGEKRTPGIIDLDGRFWPVDVLDPYKPIGAVLGYDGWDPTKKGPPPRTASEIPMWLPCEKCGNRASRFQDHVLCKECQEKEN